MTDGPYALPKGWRWARLADVVTASFSGGTPSTKVHTYWDGDIPWTTSAAITDDDVFLTNYVRTITPEALQHSSTRLAPAGSLVVATRVGVGKAAVTTFDIAISQDLTALVLRDDVEPKFLAYLFRSGPLQAQLQARSRGTTVKGITRQELLAAIIPLPPLPEQERIVARIECLMMRIREARRLRKEASKAADHLIRASLAKIFPRDGAELPPGWRWVRLGEVCETTSGGTPSRKRMDYFGGEIPWVKSGELKDGPIFETEETITRAGLEASNAKLYPPGTLLMAMYGATAGRLGVLRVQAATNQAICAIFPDEGRLRQDYLFYFLLFKREQLMHRSQGGAQPNISQKIIRDIAVPLPPRDEQRQIANYLDSVRRDVESLQKAQSAADMELQLLQQAILDSAFRGQL